MAARLTMSPKPRRTTTAGQWVDGMSRIIDKQTNIGGLCRTLQDLLLPSPSEESLLPVAKVYNQKWKQFIYRQETYKLLLNYASILVVVSPGFNDGHHSLGHRLIEGIEILQGWSVSRPWARFFSNLRYFQFEQTNFERLLFLNE